MLDSLKFFYSGQNIQVTIHFIIFLHDMLYFYIGMSVFKFICYYKYLFFKKIEQFNILNVFI